MIHDWKVPELEITDFDYHIEHPQLKPYHIKSQNLKLVEIIKVSDKPTYDTSLEGS